MKIEIVTGAHNNPVAEFFSTRSTPETDACPHCGTESYGHDERDYWKCGTIRYEEKYVVRADLCNEREARKAAESKLAEAREELLAFKRERGADLEEAHRLLRRIATKGEFMDMEGQRLVVSDWLARRHIFGQKKGDSKMSERPTPETDTFFLKRGMWNDEILAFCRKLERERDEEREDATNYYAKIGELEQERNKAMRLFESGKPLYFVFGGVVGVVGTWIIALFFYIIK